MQTRRCRCCLGELFISDSADRRLIDSSNTRKKKKKIQFFSICFLVLLFYRVLAAPGCGVVVVGQGVGWGVTMREPFPACFSTPDRPPRASPPLRDAMEVCGGWRQFLLKKRPLPSDFKFGFKKNAGGKPSEEEEALSPRCDSTLVNISACVSLREPCDTRPLFHSDSNADRLLFLPLSAPRENPKSQLFWKISQ